MRKFVLALGLLMVGCAPVPQRVLIDDDRVRPLLAAAAHFDRARYGFTPIPKGIVVTLESVPNDGYDAMLHINSKTSRTIAFKKTSTGYAWIGEQEVFQGPQSYRASGATAFKEAIILTYDVAQVSGYPLNRLNIVYNGADPRLANASLLTLKKIKPILKEWGY